MLYRRRGQRTNKSKQNLEPGYGKDKYQKAQKHNKSIVQQKQSIAQFSHFQGRKRNYRNISVLRGNKQQNVDFVDDQFCPDSFENAVKDECFNQTHSQLDFKRYNAKQAELQSKISKIKTYENKISNLLNFVKDKTPQKLKVSEVQQKLIPRSKSTLSFTKKSSDFKFENQETYTPHKPFQIQKPLSMLKDHQKSRRQQAVNITGKRRKQFMKSMEKEVKQIQKTVQTLNLKIKNTDKLNFKKNISFDELTESTNNEKQIQQYRDSYLKFKNQNRKQCLKQNNFRRKTSRSPFLTPQRKYRQKSTQRRQSSSFIKRSVGQIYKQQK